jgi:Zn-dependent protease
MESMIQRIIILAIPILLAITLHEYAHGWVANRLGDPTARLLGRLTLNPIKHLDPIGTLAFFITGMIGWAKPVPVNTLQLKDPKRDMMWVALAGPLTNISLAAASALFLKLLSITGLTHNYSLLPVIRPIYLMAQASVMINVGLAIFNIIPVPPLDGSRILAGLLPYRHAIVFSRIEPYGFIILIALMFTGIVHIVISPIVFLIVGILLGGRF